MFTNPSAVVGDGFAAVAVSHTLLVLRAYRAAVAYGGTLDHDHPSSNPWRTQDAEHHAASSSQACCLVFSILQLFMGCSENVVGCALSA